MTQTDRRIIGGGVAAMAAFCIWAMVGPDATAGDRLGIRRFTTPEVSGTFRVGQTFVMDAEGLFAVEVRPVAVGPALGAVRLELRPSYDLGVPAIREAVVPASDFVRNDTYRFEFAPVTDSVDRLFRLDISSSPDAPSAGVALRATMGERLFAGALRYNDVERWADLAFQTYSTSPLRGRRAARFAFAGLALSVTALIFVLRELARP
jgi:hypothetical protein